MFWQQADIFSLGLSPCPHEDDLDRLQPIPETEKVDTERLMFIFQTCTALGQANVSLKGLSHEMDLAFDDMYG
jgi:hypothetical protein